MTSKAPSLAQMLAEDRRDFERTRLVAEAALERLAASSDRTAVAGAMQRLTRARYRLGLSHRD